MLVLQAAALGIVQGITEFLPISSSAHLLLFRAFLGWDDGRLGLTFDVACHLGTLLAILAYYRRDVAAMTAALPQAVRGAGDESAALAGRIGIGTIPILLAGLVLTRTMEEAVRAVWVTSLTLSAGAVLFLLAERRGARRRDDRSLTPAEALLLGGAQALALVPGVSRSGAVIVAGLFLGLRRDQAARFAFLLGVPAMLAAGGHEALGLEAGALPPEALAVFAAGALTSAVVGYGTIKYFIRYLADHRLDLFAWYRFALAAVTILWMLQP